MEKKKERQGKYLYLYLRIRLAEHFSRLFTSITYQIIYGEQPQWFSFPNKCIQTITVTACVSSALLRDGVLLPPSAETALTFHCRGTVKKPIKNSLKRWLNSNNHGNTMKQKVSL